MRRASGDAVAPSGLKRPEPTPGPCEDVLVDAALQQRAALRETGSEDAMPDVFLHKAIATYSRSEPESIFRV
jgi:hypothetical protein